MQFYTAKRVEMSFDEAIERVTAELKAEGFGVLTDIDVRDTLKKKINVDFRRYRILGACNPPFAHKALSLEDKVGLMMPCNVVVQDLPGGGVEVAAINPEVGMQAIGNEALAGLAAEVRAKLERAIARV